MYKIIVDLLGADHSETELVLGAIRAVNDIEDLAVCLCGKEEELAPVLAELTYDTEKVELINCTQEITNYDEPVSAYHEKTDSTLIKGLKLCRTREDVDGFVTCGPTGVVLISSILVLGKICALRPALACVLRGKDNKEFCIVDCGANVECNADRYHDFARLGVAYMKSTGLENPRVALLSNGEEAGKGSETIKQAFEKLEEGAFHFVGNAEGTDVMNDFADVIVCDGMSGNVLLKSIEGTAKRFYADILEHLEDDNTAQAAAAPDAMDKEEMKALLARLVKKYDYNNEGGAILLGVQKPVIKGHGAATADTIYHSIQMAYNLAKNQVVDKIRDEFRK